MRYRENQPPDPEQPFGASMHNMLDFSMVLAFLIGLALLLIARHGRVLWLTVWSVGLLVASVGYLLIDNIDAF